MKILFYSAKEYELSYLKASASANLDIAFTPEVLSAGTAVLAEVFDAISVFTSDDASTEVIRQLYKSGVHYIAARSAGYDNIDLVTAGEVGIRVANVPEYSPNAIAEHAVALMLGLNRKLIKATSQVQHNNFTVDNLVGFDLNKKKVGIIGMGRIGITVAKILDGFGCRIMAYDAVPDITLPEKYNLFYTGLHTLCSMCDIITIHLPLNTKTRHLIDKRLISIMKPGVMLINTARGAVVNTQDVITGLSTGQIGYFGMDVYEYEKGLFFNDWSNRPINDNLLTQLIAFDNVMVTPHQGFATHEALSAIAAATFHNLACWANEQKPANEIALYTFPGIEAANAV